LRRLDDSQSKNPASDWTGPTTSPIRAAAGQAHSAPDGHPSIQLTEKLEFPMAFTVILHAKAKPGRSHDVVDFYRETLGATRSRPGCITAFALIEQWDDKRDQEAYAAWRAETGGDVLAQFGELLAAPLRIEFYEEINA
jgi:quinol monooxygenase YgiN